MEKVEKMKIGLDMNEGETGSQSEARSLFQRWSEAHWKVRWEIFKDVVSGRGSGTTEDENYLFIH